MPGPQNDGGGEQQAAFANLPFNECKTQLDELVKLSDNVTVTGNTVNISSSDWTKIQSALTRARATFDRIYQTYQQTMPAGASGHGGRNVA
jgi:hypothetical protein